MIEKYDLKKNKVFGKKILVYGLGATGKSVIKFLKKKKIFDYKVWDDDKKKRQKFANKIIDKALNNIDFIVLSPGINLNNALLKSKLIKNKKKIITDLDLFYLFNPEAKTIGITGTNGKSTTCKIIHHILKKNGYQVKLGGNIGKPILDILCNSNTIVIIEMSSFQLAYSKFIKPNFGVLLNLSIDHLDWHRNFSDYKNSKFKIFFNQGKFDKAYISSQALIKFFKNEKFHSKLIKVPKKISPNSNKFNEYLNFKPNLQNLNFAYRISRDIGVNHASILKSLRDFKGLKHRYEIFLRKKNISFINDSKATSFKSSEYSLEANKNIYWILGGLPKKGDKIRLTKFQRNINRCYIIGKKTAFFVNQLRNKIKYTVSNNLKSAVINLFKDLKFENGRAVVLFSPASASYDQFKNFEQRGDIFKKLVKLYAK
tara:strand:- start:1321 stop:2604 length:1284 start_codon:yes stop_codon:yes gene_type:complete